MYYLVQYFLNLFHNFLSLFTLDSVSIFLMNQYSDDGSLRKRIKFGYWLFVLGTVRIIALFCDVFFRAKGTYLFRSDGNQNFMDYFLFNHIGEKSLLILGTCSFSLHTYNIVHYTIFHYTKYFALEISDYMRLFANLKNERFLLLDCIFGRYNQAKRSKLNQKLSKVVHFRSDPFAQQKDLYKFLQIYKLVERSE